MTLNYRVVSILKAYARWATYAVIAVGCLVMLGWILEIDRLKTGLNGLESTRFNSALCFVLLGGVVWYKQHRPISPYAQTVTTLVIGFVMAVALTNLIEVVTGWNAGIDEFFVQDTSSITLAPGRMAPVTIINFVLICMALLLAQKNSYANNAGQIFLVIAFCISLLPLLEYIFALGLDSRNEPSSNVALPTLVAFLLLISAVMSGEAERGIVSVLTSKFIGGTLLRRVLPVSIIFIIGLEWLERQGKVNNFLEVESDDVLFTSLTIALSVLTLWWMGHLMNKANRQFEEAQARLTQLAAIVESTEDAIKSVSLDGMVTSWNTAAVDLYGYTAAEIIGQPVSRLAPPDRSQEMREILIQIAKGEHIRSFETVRVRKDGTMFPVSLTISPIRDSTGQIVGTSSIDRDITERIRTEEASQRFQGYLWALHEVTIELSSINGLDDFYRRAIELGRTRLGFDRIGLFLLDESGQNMLGTFGVDTQGQIRDERHFHQKLADDPRAMKVLQSKRLMEFWEDTDLYEAWGAVGRGWSAMAVLWDGDKGIGWLASDNLIRRQPLAAYQPELLSLYAVTLGHLITRKQTEAALRDSEQRYRDLFESNDDIIIIHDLEGNILEVNEAASIRLGYSQEELLHMKTTELDKPEYGVKFNDRLEVQLRDGVLRDIMGTHIAKDGHEIPIHVNSRAITYKKQPAVMALVRDVTVLHETEAILRENEQRYRQLLEAISTPIVALDPEMNILYCNTAYAEYVGREVRQLEGRGLLEVFPTFAERPSYQLYQRALVTGQPQELSGFSGSIYFLLRVYPTSFGVLAVAHDLTDQHRAQQQANDLLLERERTHILTDFVHDASHEFRTPLTIMQSGLYLIDRLENPLLRQKHTERILAQVDHLVKLVDQLVLMAKLDSQKTADLRPVMLGNLIDQLLTEYQREARGRNIAFQVSVKDEACKFDADETQVRMALGNLLDNAIRFTADGGTVTLDARRSNGTVCIEIRDSGTGIAADKLNKVFERFYREDNAHTTPGFGLGLPITKAIIEQHGGKIEVESQMGQGSTFRVFLPTQEKP